MTKKTLLIAILISLLGLIASAKPQATDNQDKAQIAGPAKHAQRVNQWSNGLKAAYEAKDMDKIGKLIEQMDNFKARIRKAPAGKRIQEGEKRGKGERAEKTKFYEGNRKENKQRKQRQMNKWQDNDKGDFQNNDMENCQDNDMPRHAKKAWKKHNRQGQDEDQDQDQCERPYRQFAQRPHHSMGRGMRNYQGGRQQYGFDSGCQNGPRRFAGQRRRGMQRGFARRGQGMMNQGQQYQSPQKRYQGQGFAENMRGQGQMGQGRMRKNWSGQNQWQGPRAMQRQGNFQGQQKMARGFENRQDGQCPVYQQQRGFDRPCNQQKSWGNRKFKGPEMKHQGRGRNRQEVTPSGNEWEW
jgi:hypothetical protein